MPSRSHAPVPGFGAAALASTVLAWVALAWGVGCAAPAPGVSPTTSGAADVRLTAAELQQPLPQRTARPIAEERAILDQIQVYNSWPNFPELQRPKFSTAHGGRWVLAFYNGVVGAAMAKGLLPLPDGAQIILENRHSQDTNEPAVLTTMSKVSGEWYWMELTDASVRLDEDERPIAGTGEAGSAACASCHAQASDNDYVFTHDFKRRAPARRAR